MVQITAELGDRRQQQHQHWQSDRQLDQLDTTLTSFIRFDHLDPRMISVSAAGPFLLSDKALEQ